MCKNGALRIKTETEENNIIYINAITSNTWFNRRGDIVGTWIAGIIMLKSQKTFFYIIIHEKTETNFCWTLLGQCWFLCLQNMYHAYY